MTGDLFFGDDAAQLFRHPVVGFVYTAALLQQQATLHGYHIVFSYAAIFLVAGAVVAGLLLRRGAMATLAKAAATGDGPAAEVEPVLVTAMHLFDDGWNAVAERIFANQKKLGVVPLLIRLDMPTTPSLPTTHSSVMSPSDST